MLKIDFRAMGCSMAVFLDNESAAAEQILQQVPAWLEEWEQILSRFRPESELNQLNRSPQTLFPASPVLWEVTQAALDAALWTDGIISPTILPALVHSGYDRSFEQLPKIRPEADPAIYDIPDLQLWRSIQLDPQRHTITLPAGAALDFGGIGKGWAAQNVMHRLKEYGPVLVDAGGDLAVSGPQRDLHPWLIGVVDSLQPDQNLDLLAIDSGGIATSGIDFRRWLRGDTWMHHIIDPRSGKPAETDLVSVTVLAEDALQAEAAAKMILIQGSQAGLEWLDQQGHLAALLAFPDGRVVYSPGIYPYLWSE